MAASRLCSIPDCGKRHYGRGYCRAHWKRFARYGDPHAGSTKWGEVRSWLDSVAVPYVGDDCLVFPYYRNASGYGWANIAGQHVGAHVYVLAQVSGDKPSPSHEACHDCGKGSEGCVAPRHLYWGTRKDNVADATAHGTGYVFPVVFGEHAPAAKFSDATIAAILAALERGDRQMTVAKNFKISQSHVSRIKHGARRNDR